MKIYEIIDREEPIEQDDDTPNAAQRFFRGAMHQFKRVINKDTKNSVMSSWIMALDYDHRTKVCVMRLKDGRNYSIRGMEPSVYYNWVKTPSQGKFFHRQVKDKYHIK